MYPKAITKISQWELYYKYHDIFRRKKNNGFVWQISSGETKYFTDCDFGNCPI